MSLFSNISMHTNKRVFILAIGVYHGNVKVHTACGGHNSVGTVKL